MVYAGLSRGIRVHGLGANQVSEGFGFRVVLSFAVRLRVSMPHSLRVGLSAWNVACISM